MSYKSSLAKMAIKWTPKVMSLWAVNHKLKGIAEITDFTFDLDSRKAYAQVTLNGEEGVIEVWLDGFGVLTDGETKKFIIQQAESNRPWLNNVFSRIVGREWKIPKIPQFAAHINLVAELLKIETPEQEQAEDHDDETETVDVGQGDRVE